VYVGFSSASLAKLGSLTVEENKVNKNMYVSVCTVLCSGGEEGVIVA